MLSYTTTALGQHYQTKQIIFTQLLKSIAWRTALRIKCLFAKVVIYMRMVRSHRIRHSRIRIKFHFVNRQLLCISLLIFPCWYSQKYSCEMYSWYQRSGRLQNRRLKLVRSDIHLAPLHWFRNDWTPWNYIVVSRSTMEEMGWRQGGKLYQGTQPDDRWLW